MFRGFADIQVSTGEGLNLMREHSGLPQVKDSYIDILLQVNVRGRFNPPKLCAKILRQGDQAMIAKAQPLHTAVSLTRPSARNAPPKMRFMPWEDVGLWEYVRAAIALIQLIPRIVDFIGWFQRRGPEKPAPVHVRVEFKAEGYVRNGGGSR